MPHDREIDVQLEALTDAETHKIPSAQPGRSTGYLRAASSRWDALVPGCEFHLLRYAQSPLYQAPLLAPRAILDLGCGAGRWAAACQAQFPHATVIGLDHKAPRPDTPSATLGFQFYQADLFDPLPFAEATFDYVHMRFMAMALPLTRWLPLLRECLRVLRPPGWLEVQELGIPHISHPTPWVWLALLGRANGVELFPGPALQKWLGQAGGTNVSIHAHAVQRVADPNASARMMIRDGIALIEMCREALLAQQIATEVAYEHELRKMQQNLFIANRQDTLPIYTATCQKA